MSGLSKWQHLQHKRMAGGNLCLVNGRGAASANSGHPGMPMGMADAATVLFSKFLKFDPKDPDWARPRQVYSCPRDTGQC